MVSNQPEGRGSRVQAFTRALGDETLRSLQPSEFLDLVRFEPLRPQAPSSFPNHQSYLVLTDCVAIAVV